MSMNMPHVTANGRNAQFVVAHGLAYFSDKIQHLGSVFMKVDYAVGAYDAAGCLTDRGVGYDHDGHPLRS